jgi:hypothetical protein
LHTQLLRTKQARHLHTDNPHITTVRVKQWQLMSMRLGRRVRAKAVACR